MMKNKQKKPEPRGKISSPDELEAIVKIEKDNTKEAAVFDVPGLAEAVTRKFQQWKERLIDLSLRNRLVNFKQTRSNTLRIVEPGISAIFDRLVKEEGEYYIYVQEEQGFLNLENSGNSSQDSTSQPPVQRPQ